jgi:hypothetical protein
VTANSKAYCTMEVIAAVKSFKDTGRRINQVLTEEYFTKHITLKLNYNRK